MTEQINPRGIFKADAASCTRHELRIAAIIHAAIREERREPSLNDFAPVPKDRNRDDWPVMIEAIRLGYVYSRDISDYLDLDCDYVRRCLVAMEEVGLLRRIDYRRGHHIQWAIS